MNTQRRRSLGFSLLVTVTALVSCADSPVDRVLGLPDISQQPLMLRTAYVENPRFRGIDDAMFDAILERSTQLVEQHLKIIVMFDEPVTIPVSGFFNNLKYRVKQEHGPDIADIDRLTDADRARLRSSIYGMLEHYWNDRELVVDFAAPYLVSELEDDDFHRLADRLVETLLARLSHWHEAVAPDGEPVIDENGYNEWVWWDSLGYGNVPFDVVITNQLVASAEYYGMDVHSSLRGGITAGSTSYSRTAQFGAYSWISVFQMINDGPVLSSLRDDDHYSDEQVVEYAATLLTHELGHLLLHLGHPFGNHNCIMSPTPLLLYRKWAGDLDASRCPLGSEEQMTPGVVKIEYRADW